MRIAGVKIEIGEKENEISKKKKFVLKLALVAK